MDFHRFCNSELQATKEKWIQESIDYDCFPEEVSKRLGLITVSNDEWKSSSSHESVYYGIFQDGQNIAVAICQMVLSDRGTKVGKWLKLLNITLSPEVDSLLLEQDEAATRTAILAYRTAVLGAFSERQNHDADTLKIYGRSREQLSFLIQLASTISIENAELSAKIEGRWLVLRTK